MLNREIEQVYDALHTVLFWSKRDTDGRESYHEKGQAEATLLGFDFREIDRYSAERNGTPAGFWYRDFIADLTGLRKRPNDRQEILNRLANRLEDLYRLSLMRANESTIPQPNYEWLIEQLKSEPDRELVMVHRHQQHLDAFNLDDSRVGEVEDHMQLMASKFNLHESLIADNLAANLTDERRELGQARLIRQQMLFASDREYAFFLPSLRSVTRPEGMQIKDRLADVFHACASAVDMDQSIANLSPAMQWCVTLFNHDSIRKVPGFSLPGVESARISGPREASARLLAWKKQPAVLAAEPISTPSKQASGKKPKRTRKRKKEPTTAVMLVQRYLRDQHFDENDEFIGGQALGPEEIARKIKIESESRPELKRGFSKPTLSRAFAELFQNGHRSYCELLANNQVRLLEIIDGKIDGRLPNTDGNETVNSVSS